MQTSIQAPFDLYRLRYYVAHLFGVCLEPSEFTTGLIELIRIALGKLGATNPRELDIILLRYGLIDGQFKTLDEVSVLLVPAVTKQAISPLLRRAVHRLRSPGWSADIRTCLKAMQEAQG